jgi:hypothetical protein
VFAANSVIQFERRRLYAIRHRVTRPNSSEGAPGNVLISNSFAGSELDTAILFCLAVAGFSQLQYGFFRTFAVGIYRLDARTGLRFDVPDALLRLVAER